MLVIDGAYGEGGGQVLRTSLSLACILGVGVRLVNIRAKRRVPGLRPQHVTVAGALARVCKATVEGGRVGSTQLTFRPRSAPLAGHYRFDVAEALKGGSAGSVSLVFQALLAPLAYARDDSRLELSGGTHVAWSPPYDYLGGAYLPIVRRLGFEGSVCLGQWGWYPIGGGRMVCQIRGRGCSARGPESPFPTPLRLEDRGRLLCITGASAASGLPEHVIQRQKRAAETILSAQGLDAEIGLVRGQSRGRGSMLFLLAHCEHVDVAFTGYGRRGKPAEKVAEEACSQLLHWWQSGAALDRHLADQVLLPLALARGESSLTTCCMTEHLLTNAWVIERFGLARVKLEGELGKPGMIAVTPEGRGAGIPGED